MAPTVVLREDLLGKFSAYSVIQQIQHECKYVQIPFSIHSFDGELTKLKEKGKRW